MSNTDDSNKTSDKAHVISLSTESTSITNNSIIGKLDFEAPLNNVKDVNTQNNNIIASINIQAENTYSNTSSGGNWSYDHTGGALEKIWTTTENHGLQVNDPIIFTNVVGGATGYIINTIYYVKEVKSKTTLTLSDSIGGTIVDGISDSSGTWNASKSEMPTGLTMKINDIEKIKISKDGDITNSGDTIINQPTFDNYSISGLVGWWKLDESSGNTAIDSSGNGNNVTNNGATVTATGYDGSLYGAYSFDGTDDYITTGDINTGSGGLGITTNRITVSCWAMSNEATGNWSANGCLISKRDGFVLHPNAGNKTIYFMIRDGSTTYFSGTYTMNDIKTWHLYTGTYDGSYVGLYIDGIEVVKTSHSDKTIYNDNGPLRIGVDDYADSSFPDRLFNGVIDDVRIYNRALTAEEVYKLYYKPEGNLTITNLISGADKNLPVAYYKLDESSGTVALDSSGNNYHGTNIGATVTAAGYDGTNNGAYSFDGSNDYISIPNPSLDLSGNLTISLWFKRNNTNMHEVLISKDIDKEFTLYFENYLRFYQGNSHVNGPATSTFLLNQWYHVAVTREGASGNWNIKYYVNGLFSVVANDTDDPVSSSYDIFIGTLNNNGSPVNYFNGSIDNVRIYNLALTGSEIKKIYLDSEQTKIGLEIQKNGFVGIGTSNPIAPLHIKNDNVEVTNDSYIDNKANACIALEQNASTWRISINNNDRLLFSNDTSSTTNIKGYIKSYAEHTTNSDLVTFTGQHRNLCNSNIDSSNIGLIVSSSGKFVNLDNSLEASINESLPIVQLSPVENDIKVFGVLCDKEDLNNNRNFASGNFVSIMDKTNQNEQRIFVNSLGEGAIWVSNKNGLIENGDFITSSNIKGYGVKQLRNGNTDNFLTNYTVAKITCDCNFSLNKVPKTIVKTINNEIQYDTNGDIVFINDLDSSGNQQLIYPLQTRFIDSLGNQLQDETDYNNRLNNGEMVYIACFVGCTYHCG